MSDLETNDATAPTAEELDAARAVIARAEQAAQASRDAVQAKLAAAAQASKDAMVRLVTMPEFIAVEKAMHDTQALVRADDNLNYAISMFSRLRSNFTPAS